MKPTPEEDKSEAITKIGKVVDDLLATILTKLRAARDKTQAKLDALEKEDEQ